MLLIIIMACCSQLITNMEFRDFLLLIGRKKQTIFLIAMFFLAIAAVFTFVQPLKYEAKSQLLVIQDYRAGTDSYTISKSNEFLSNILARVVKSDSFFFEVINSGFDINKNYYSGDERNRVKAWDDTVEANVVNDSGIIQISVYHKDGWQAKQIAEAINYVLKTKNSNYHGAGNDVKVKIIGNPIISKWPVKPNIALNIVLGLVFGFMVGFIYIYLFPEEHYDLKFFLKKNKNRQELRYVNNFVNPVYGFKEREKEEVIIYDNEDKEVENKTINQEDRIKKELADNVEKVNNNNKDNDYIISGNIKNLIN